MTNLLIKLFIRGDKNAKDGKVRAKYASLAGVTGIVVNFLLFVGKLIIGLLAKSVAIIADAFNNISDAGSSVVTLIGFRLANKPVDKEHPLGHGRFEYVTGFIVDMLIILVGAELLFTSVEKIFAPVQTETSTATFVVLAVAVLVKVWLFCFYKKIGKTIASNALKASAADSLSDCVATSLVLLSAILSKFSLLGGFPLDGVMGVLVALFILYTGVKASKETIDLLLGSPPDPAFIDEIYAFVKRYPEVVGIHDVMVHDYGPGRQIVSFHAETPSDYDVNLAHEVIDKIERDMFDAFHCIVTIHLDPIVVNDEEVNAMRAAACECAKAVDPAFTIHDFRMTKGEKHINVIFDLLVPADAKLSNDDAAKAVANEIRQRHPNCFAVIKAEHPFV